MPSAAYEIGYFTVTKEGTLEFDDRAEQRGRWKTCWSSLLTGGIVAAPAEMAQAWLNARAEELSKASENEPQEANVGLTVEIPLDKVSLGNLTKLLEAKGKLIRKALGISELSFEIMEDRGGVSLVRGTARFRCC